MGQTPLVPLGPLADSKWTATQLVGATSVTTPKVERALICNVAVQRWQSRNPVHSLSKVHR